jgi:signal transduction histidine kinase
MRRASLAGRLLLTSLAGLLVVLGAGGIALSYAFSRSVETAFDLRLAAWSDALVSSLSVDAGRVVLERPLGDPRFQRALSGWYWVVGDDAAPLLTSASLWDAALRVEAEDEEGDRRGGPAVRRAVGPRDQRLRALVLAVTLPGREQPLRVVVAADTEELQREIDRFDVLLAVSLAALGAALLGLVGIQLRLALRPAQRLTADLAEVRRGHRTRVGEDAPRELVALADAVNDLLAHDAELVERARTQTADLAHVLKTPLSLVMAEAGELADDRGRRISGHAEAMRRHIDRRLGGAYPRTAVAGKRIPLRPVVEGIVQTLSRLHPAREIELDAAEDLMFPGPREDLEEIAGNLLENACKWARRRVRLRGRGDANGLELCVDDDGPGLEPPEREEVLERGVRLDVTAPGAGLGLGIVRDVAAAYRGRLRLDASDLGGLRAVVTLAVPG